MDGTEQTQSNADSARQITLTDFLLARIDEDEAGARAEAEMQVRFSAPPFTVRYEWACITEHENGAQGTAFAIGCPSPARVLAECEAKRQIVAHHRPIPDEYVLCAICTEVGPDAQGWPCLSLRLFALPYADHPDYRQEWKP